MQLGFVYLRLARLEQQNGHGDRADDFIGKARREFQLIGWRDVSASALNAALDQRVNYWRSCPKDLRQ
jgi:hypothetical protein